MQANKTCTQGTISACRCVASAVVYDVMNGNRCTCSQASENELTVHDE
jgi:hypothetical protein